MNLAILALALCASKANAQLEYLGGPLTKFMPMSVPPVGTGCGAFVTPGDEMLVVTSSNSQVSGFDAETGDTIFIYRPTDEDMNGMDTFSTSGVSFGMVGGEKYLVTGISYGFQNTDSTFCQIVALHPNGTTFWKSEIFDGACSGTPVIGEDGSLVFFTRNTLTYGYFTILSAGLDGDVFYNNFTHSRPFAPPGIYHDPAEGYYMEGTGNTNDLVIFASTAFPDETGVDSGSLFAFQLPLLDAEPTVNVIHNSSSWYSFSPPKLSNFGYSMYMTVSRNQFRAWIGSAGDKNNQFHKASTANVEFARGKPAWLAPAASVALSSSPTEPMVFGGTSANLMVGLTYDMQQMWAVNSSSSILVEAKVSPQDDRVYWVEENSKVHSSNALTGEDFWVTQISSIPVRSSFALSSDGSTLYLADFAGNVIAWTVAFPPSSSPTVKASEVPSASPSTVPTTVMPTTIASGSPSTSPSATATLAPSTAPISVSPTTEPTVATASSASPTLRTLAPSTGINSLPTSGAAAAKLLISTVGVFATVLLL